MLGILRMEAEMSILHEFACALIEVAIEARKALGNQANEAFKLVLRDKPRFQSMLCYLAQYKEVSKPISDLLYDILGVEPNQLNFYS
jgi:hypothetical protein